MKLSYFLLLLVVAAALTSGLTYFVYTLSLETLPKGTQSLPYLFYVNDTTGLDVGTDKLRLGAITPGSLAYRGIFIKDSLAEVVTSNQTVRQVRFAARGPGSEWLTFKPEVLSVPGEVMVTVTIPKDAQYAAYRGEILVIPERNS